jgi:hypothetical protein
MNFCRSEDSADSRPKRTTSGLNQTGSPLRLKQMNQSRLNESIGNFTNETLPVFRNIGFNNAFGKEQYERDNSTSPGLSRRLQFEKSQNFQD